MAIPNVPSLPPGTVSRTSRTIVAERPAAVKCGLAYEGRGGTSRAALLRRMRHPIDPSVSPMDHSRGKHHPRGTALDRFSDTPELVTGDNDRKDESQCQMNDPAKDTSSTSSSA